MRFPLACLLLFAATLSAADIYVSTSGVDAAGGGSLAMPFATLAYAHSNASAGDRIIFRGGTYTGGVYITVNNLTFESYTGEWAIISLPNMTSGQDNAFYIGTASNCTVRNLELMGGYFYAIKIDTGPCLIEDCKIHGSGRDCVKIPGADNITIRRCEIYDSGLRDPSNAEGIDNVNGDTMIVQDCYIHDIATNGLYPKGGSIGSIIERNLIRNCGGSGISMAQSSGTAFYDTVANPEYYGCRDCIARNNIIENCQGAGIDLEAALRPKVYNNTMVNVAENNKGGIRISLSSFGGTPPDVPCRDCDIQNNIIVLSATSPRPMLFMGNNSHQGTLTMSNNRYYKTGGTAVYWWEPTGQYSLNLAGWKTSSGTDANSTEGNPMLNASWHLAAGSPCINAGATLAGFTNDYDGNTRSGSWDIGADESGGTALPTPPPAGVIGTGGGQTGGFGPTITTTTLPTAALGTGYSTSISAMGGTLPYTWSLSAGNLPPGLTLDTTATGASTTLSGTPTSAGTYNFTVAVNSGAGSDTQPYTMIVTPLTADDVSGPTDGPSDCMASDSPSAAGGIFWVLGGALGLVAMAGWLNRREDCKRPARA